ncbi:MAG: hypothetical protein M1834_009504 [Cirrosporium novae-zelandiae]|nr:MAG: hypothetical protein M1834_009504 [Cirrosporium novae-zelandiae]
MSDLSYVPSQLGRKLARTYVDENAEDLHKAFATPTQYDEQRAQYKAKGPINNDKLRVGTDQFFSVMEAYQKCTKDESSASFNIRNKHGWDEVIREARRAEQKYNDACRGRKLFRFSGDYAAAISPFFKLIPSTEYTSVLCGGLALIFGIAARLSQKRLEILQALKDVPDTIEMAEKCLEKFPSDLKLRDINIELYLSILSALESIIEWLVDSPFRKTIRAAFKGKFQERALDERIQEINSQVLTLQHHYHDLLHKTVIQTEATARRTELKLDNVKDITVSTQHQIKSVGTDIQLGVVKVDSKVSRVLEEATWLKESHNALTIRITDMQKVIDAQEGQGVEAKNSLQGFLQEQIRFAAWNIKKDISAEFERRSPIPSFRPLITHDQLVTLLAANPAITDHDLQTVIREGHRIDLDSQNRVQWLMKCTTFQAWLGSRNAQVLLVDGNSTSRTLGRESEMSLLCAMLVQSLSGIPLSMPILFFCGLHTDDESDALAGPSGLIRSLITQLLHVHTFNLGFISTRRHRDQINSLQLEHLCELFSTLVSTLPVDTVVFCMIDGISFYENDQWQAGLCFIIQKLQELADDESINAIFKLLITTPLMSRYVEYQIDPQDRLTMPRNIGGPTYGLTERSMAMDTRQAMEQMPLNLWVEQQDPNFAAERENIRYMDEGYGDQDVDDRLSDESVEIF